MSQAADPFERAVEREENLRQRAARFDSPAGVISLAVRWFLALGAGWAAILAGHWTLLGEPRWLVVLHTVVFALAVGYLLITYAAFVIMRKRRPDWFGEA